MKQRDFFKSVFSVFLISCLYFGLFLSLFALFRSSAFVIISIVFVSYIAWKRGVVAALLLSIFNFLWNALVIYLLSPHLPFSTEAYINVAVHIGVSILLGYFGKLARDLRKEVEARKRTEALLKDYQNELEDRVKARTLELEKAKEKLHQAEKMEAIGQLAGGIAHDFNNYLNIIIGYSAMIIAKMDASAQIEDYAKRLEQAAHSASELTSQLLTFARKKKLELHPLDLADVVKKMLPLLSRGIKKGIIIKQASEPDLPRIRGDASQVQNALINLGLNANDAMRESGELTFTTKKIDVTPDYCRQTGVTLQPGTYVGVCVTDTGSGIEPAALAHLFEPFFTTKPEGKGTGLGLATVYGIAQSHQGAVFADTMPGKGATFTMLFPIIKEPPT